MSTLDLKKTDELIRDAETFAKKVTIDERNDKNRIRTNQIRNFYSGVIAIKQEFEKNGKKWNESIETKVQLLKPALAYAAGRQKAVKPFKEFIEHKIDGLLRSTNKEKALENFFVLIESFIAYHKFYGGKD